MAGIMGAVQAGVGFARDFSQVSKAIANTGARAATASAKNVETGQKLVEAGAQSQKESARSGGFQGRHSSVVNISANITTGTGRTNQKGKKVDTQA